jgi:guanylate kinase
MEQRLATAREELAAQDEFGHVVVNDRLEEAADDLVAIIARELTEQ